MEGIVPIRKIIRKKALLELLESQFPKTTELGLELFDKTNAINYTIERFRLYAKVRGGDYSRDRFRIHRTRVRGKIREYCLEGSIYFD